MKLGYTNVFEWILVVGAGLFALTGAAPGPVYFAGCLFMLVIFVLGTTLLHLLNLGALHEFSRPGREAMATTEAAQRRIQFKMHVVTLRSTLKSRLGATWSLSTFALMLAMFFIYGFHWMPVVMATCMFTMVFGNYMTVRALDKISLDLKLDLQ